MEKQYFHFPRWVTALYAFSAAVLLPWTFYLAENLPARHLAQHWDLAWTGFDIFMIILLLVTVVMAIQRTIWLAISATGLATVLLVDAWFDVLTARPGHQQVVALSFALFIEVPLALLTYTLAVRSVRNLHRHLLHIIRQHHAGEPPDLPPRSVL